MYLNVFLKRCSVYKKKKEELKNPLISY